VEQTELEPPSKRSSNVADSDIGSFPASPLTTLTAPSTPSKVMESEDEFSGTSSQEEAFHNADDSDDGSLGSFSSYCDDAFASNCLLIQPNLCRLRRR
jgi:hypothetical protein